MANLNHSKIFIDGEEQFQDVAYDVEITQSVGTHHSFSVIFPISSVEGFAATLMDKSMEFIGKKISIYFENPLYSGELEFVGIIDDIGLNKTNAGAGAIHINGKSPDALLHARYDCRSFKQDTSLGDVTAGIFGNYDSKILPVNYGGALDENIPYTVQYNETDYNFLSRMSSRYGYLSYYNGTSFCIGFYEQQEISGTYGANISSFSLKASLSEQNFSVNQYDWINDTALKAHSANTKPSGKHNYVDIVKKNSDSVYAAEGYYDFSHGQPEYGGQQGADQLSKIMTQSKSSDMLTAAGNSYLVNLRIGDILKVEGVNFSDHKQKDAYGSFLIVGLTHRFNSSGEYINMFHGVPKKTDYVLSHGFTSYPRAANQRAKVVDNTDPEGLGRIKVNFPWQREGGEETPWIKMATPYAGADKGFYFIPEIGEEVLVGFENGDAEKPFVLSAGFNQKAKSGIDNADNNIKAVVTRSGHRIELNDTEGSESITITDKNNNIILIETANNNISISAGENMTLNAKNIKITAEENIEVQAKGNIEIASEGDTSILTKGKTNLQAKSDTEITSSASISIDATTDAKLKGQNVTLEGQANAELKGMQTKVKGQMTAIQGASGKIDVI